MSQQSISNNHIKPAEIRFGLSHEREAVTAEPRLATPGTLRYVAIVNWLPESSQSREDIHSQIVSPPIIPITKRSPH